MTEMNPQAVRLVFTDADPESPNPELVADIARGATDALQSAGFAVNPTQDGSAGPTLFDISRSGDLAVEDAETFLGALAQLGTPIVAYLMERRAAQAEQGEATTPPVFFVSVDNATEAIPVSGPMSESDLRTRLMAIAPSLSGPVIAQSEIQIDVRVPGQPAVED